MLAFEPPATHQNGDAVIALLLSPGVFVKNAYFNQHSHSGKIFTRSMNISSSSRERYWIVRSC